MWREGGGVLGNAMDAEVEKHGEAHKHTTIQLSSADMNKPRRHRDGAWARRLRDDRGVCRNTPQWCEGSRGGRGGGGCIRWPVQRSTVSGFGTAIARGMTWVQLCAQQSKVSSRTEIVTRLMQGSSTCKTRDMSTCNSPPPSKAPGHRATCVHCGTVCRMVRCGSCSSVP
jgi:hypothetical protein